MIVSFKSKCAKFYPKVRTSEGMFRKLEKHNYGPSFGSFPLVFELLWKQWVLIAQMLGMSFEQPIKFMRRGVCLRALQCITDNMTPPAGIYLSKNSLSNNRWNIFWKHAAQEETDSQVFFACNNVHCGKY